MLAATCLACLARAESQYAYGFHSWDEGCDLLVMNGKTGWYTRYQPVWQSVPLSELEKACGEGFTIIMGLFESWTEAFPADPADWHDFAAQCAGVADYVGDYVHIFHVGNEMDVGHLQPLMEQFAPLFRMISDAIHSVRPDAIVCCGAPINLSYFSEMADVLGDEPDGYQSHIRVEELFFEHMRVVPGARRKPMYVTEFMRLPYWPSAAPDFFFEIQDWNAANPEQQVACGCWFVYYLAGWEESSLINIPQAVDDWSWMTANTAITNQYAARPIAGSGYSADVLSESSAEISWETDVASTTQLSWYGDGASDSDSTPLDTALGVVHLAYATGLSPWQLYTVWGRSTATGYGDLAYGPFRFGTASSSEWLPAGWNLISLPLRMPDPSVEDVLAGLGPGAATNNLYRYSPGVGYEIHPGAFTEMERGRGYWLRLDEAVSVSTCGAYASGTQEVALVAGWNLIGHPLEVSVPLSQVQVTDGVQTVSLSAAESAGWLQAIFYAYDSGYVAHTPSSGLLQPWSGYWLLCYSDGLSLLIERY